MSTPDYCDLSQGQADKRALKSPTTSTWANRLSVKFYIFEA